mgnify:CR=1 FL=1
MSKSDWAFLGISSLVIVAIFYFADSYGKVTEQPALAPAPVQVTQLKVEGSTSYTTRFYTVEYTDEIGDTYTFLACSLSNGGGITMELLKVNGQLVSHVPRENK